LTKINERNNTHYPFTWEKKIFETSYKEPFRNNKTNYKFAHLLENSYAFGKIDGIMDIKHLARKVAHKDIMERYLYMKELRRIVK
jgi:hypothetical protein